jgi:hypothetical protein
MGLSRKRSITSSLLGVVWDREREEGMRIIQRKGMGREEKGRGRKEG